jgi:hypothetical protein
MHRREYDTVDDPEFRVYDKLLTKRGGGLPRSDDFAGLRRAIQIPLCLFMARAEV